MTSTHFYVVSIICNPIDMMLLIDVIYYEHINTLRPRQNGRHFTDDIFKCIFLNENVSIAIKNSLKFVPKGPINDIPALVKIMAWRRSGDKPLSEPMMVSLPTHICVTRPQWVKKIRSFCRIQKWRILGSAETQKQKGLQGDSPDIH